MKITCERDQLLSAFQLITPVVPSRSPKPILQRIKISATPEQTIAMATDTEIGIRQEVDGVEVTSAGSVVVPVDRFGSILRESSDEKMRIESDGQTIKVSGQRSQFELTAENPDEFPDVDGFHEDRYAELPAALMKELIRRTLFATDTESSRYALGGILLEFEESKVTAVGTDGRRLAKMEGPAQSLGGHHESEAMTIVPARAMQLMERTLTDGEAEVRLAARTNDLLLRTSRTTLYSRLVEGRFPKWRDVIPNDPDAHAIEVTVGPFFAAVRQAAIVANKESRGISLTFGDGNLVMTGSTAQVGASRVEMPIAYTGDPIQVSLDNRFLAEFLRVLDPEKKVTLFVRDNDHPAVFRTDDEYLYVVMPMAKDRR